MWFVIGVRDTFMIMYFLILLEGIYLLSYGAANNLYILLLGIFVIFFGIWKIKTIL